MDRNTRTCTTGVADGCLCPVCDWQGQELFEAATLLAAEFAALDVFHAAPAIDEAVMRARERVHSREYAVHVLERLEASGCILRLHAGTLEVIPFESIPAALRSEVLRLPLRADLEDLLDERDSKPHPPDVPAL